MRPHSATRTAPAQLARRLKQAALGGDGQDTPFEQAFSSLAHAYLRDKAPSLLDHELGFQLIDRNQDSTKALGVFGFKVGSQLLLAPVVFLRGELKGHELLYIKGEGRFVPLKESWLNDILNRRPSILGSSTPRNTAGIGVQQPDLSRLSQPPSKYASALPAWTREGLPALCRALELDVAGARQKYAEAINLPKFCREYASPLQLSWLVKQAQRYPRFAAAIVKHYGSFDFVRDAIPRAAAREKRASVTSVLDAAPKNRARLTGSVLDAVDPPVKTASPLQTGALVVLERDRLSKAAAADLSDDDREQLARDGLLVKDTRSGEQVSVPYESQPNKSLTNPTASGLYQVLTTSGEFVKCFVAMHPQGGDRRTTFATVVRLSDDRDWMNVHPSRIWVAEKLEDQEYADWFAGLPAATDFSTRKRQLIVSPTGDTSLPFLVERSLPGGVYEANFSDYCERPLPFGSPQDTESGPSDDRDYVSWRDGARVRLDSRDGTKMRSARGDLWVPTDCKKLAVEPAESDGEGVPIAVAAESRSDNTKFRLGTFDDAQRAIMAKTAAVKVSHCGSMIRINAREWLPTSAVAHLVRDHGLREDAARHILKAAAGRGNLAYVFRIKYAASFTGDPYLTNGSPTAPGFPEPEPAGDTMGWSGATLGDSQQRVPVTDIARSDPDAYAMRPDDAGGPNEADTANIERAVASGQKEVLDASAIAGMVRSSRDDSLIDEALPDLLSGMHRLGELLLRFYWQMDTFAKRYGKQDLPELEDLLRDSFEMVGDTVLFLRKKTIRPYPEEDAVSLDLSGGK